MAFQGALSSWAADAPQRESIFLLPEPLALARDCSFAWALFYRDHLRLPPLQLSLNKRQRQGPSQVSAVRPSTVFLERGWPSTLLWSCGPSFSAAVSQRKSRHLTTRRQLKLRGQKAAQVREPVDTSKWEPVNEKDELEQRVTDVASV
jgi:hypothetical protein